MRANRIPQSLRLARRIRQLDYQVDQAIKNTDHGEVCRRCRRIVAQGHGKGCEVKGWVGQRSHYQRLLAEAQERDAQLLAQSEWEAEARLYQPELRAARRLLAAEVQG